MFRTVLQVDSFAMASLIASAHVHRAGADQGFTVDVPDEEREALIGFLVESGRERDVVRS